MQPQGPADYYESAAALALTVDLSPDQNTAAAFFNPPANHAGAPIVPTALVATASGFVQRPDPGARLSVPRVPHPG
jgi:hypothetical protein